MAGLVAGGRIEATTEGYIGRVLIRPSMPPFASYGPFSTPQEAEEAIRAWWGWCADTQQQQQQQQQQQRAEQERRAQRRREEFVARCRARQAKARQHFQRSQASVVTLDGIAYRRHEFRSLRHQPRQPRQPRSRRTRSFGRGVARTGPRRTRAPASKAEGSDEADLARLAAASARMLARIQRRAAKRRRAVA